MNEIQSDIDMYRVDKIALEDIFHVEYSDSDRPTKLGLRVEENVACHF